jgi:hypothetical protein
MDGAVFRGDVSGDEKIERFFPQIERAIRKRITQINTNGFFRVREKE